MKKFRFLLLLFFLLKLCCVTFAWGKTGHQIVARIAKYSVNSSIQDSVNKYFGSMTWEAASTWMDDIKSDPTYNYMKVWHYINIDKGKMYDSSIVNGNNVVNQLKIAIGILMKRSKHTKEEITLNLKIIFHLIGDLHQPLHVGYGSDRGGNTIKITFNGKSKNLHQIWDGDIIRCKKITYKKERSLYSKLPNDTLNKIKNATLMDWFAQSRGYLDNVYSYKSTTIDEDYINKSSVIIEKQLLDAGIRLGQILNDIFK